MLWIGWFGFNAGSALGANGGAGMAMLVTHISAATASLVWMFIEWKRFGKPSLIGIVTGMVAGLATVTPASGYIGVPGGLILGFLGYIFIKVNIPPIPIVLGFVMSPIIEQNLNRALTIHNGDLTNVLFRPITLTILFLALITIIYGVTSRR